MSRPKFLIGQARILFYIRMVLHAFLRYLSPASLEAYKRASEEVEQRPQNPALQPHGDL